MTPVALVSDVEAALTVIGKARRSVGRRRGMTRIQVASLLMWLDRQAQEGCGRGLVEVGRAEYVGERRVKTWVQDQSGRIHGHQTFEYIYADGARVTVISRREAHEILLSRLARAVYQ